MASPTVAGSIATQTFSTGGTPTDVTITLPSSIAAGERLIAVLAWDNGNSVTITPSIVTGTGWAIRDNTNTAAINSAVLEKTSASGDSADTLVVSFSGQTITEIVHVIVLRIATHTSGSALEVAQQSHTDVGGGETSANPDPPSLTPSWGSEDTLFIVVAAWDNATRTLTSYPTNYDSNQLSNLGGASSAAVGLALATRAIAGAAENPGTFTISAGEQWDAYTIAIRGTGGGDTTAPVLTSPVGTATGATTATIGATTDEGNGTLHGVVTTSATQPSIAQIKAGQDHTGSAAAWGGSASVTATGARTLSATGLTAATGYYAHLVHTDAAANDSNRVSSSLFTTDSVDTTAPVLSSPVGTATGATTATVGATTDEGNGTLYAFVSTSATPPSDADLIAGTGAVWAGSQAVTSTGAKTLSATGLTASTGYYAHLLHRDAASNDSNTVTSALFTTDAAVSNDIRLAIGIDWEEGGEFASQTVRHWSVWSLDGATMQHSGTSGTTSSGGVLTIDIDDSAFTVGDDCLFYVLFHDNATDPLDRTVRTVAGYITTTAQA